LAETDTPFVRASACAGPKSLALQLGLIYCESLPTTFNNGLE